MASPSFDAEFIGVEDFDGAPIAAGIRIIELCGGYSTRETTELRHRFPDCEIGRVTYP